MNDAHLHLLVNHLPIVGAMLSLPLFGLALLMPKDRGALRAAVLVAVFTALGGVAADLTGEPAEEVVEGLPDVTEDAIHEHEERAEVAVVTAVIGGLIAVGALVVSERKKAVHLPVTGLALLAAVATAGTMAWTGQAGGPIRHTEIREAGLVKPPGATAERRAVGGEEDDD